MDVRLLRKTRGMGGIFRTSLPVLEASALSPRVRNDALAVFTRLADAEAKIHGTSREEIHFHEVGAVDAIVDIVGSCLLLEMLGVEQVGRFLHSLRLWHDHLPARDHARACPGDDGTAFKAFPSIRWIFEANW